MTIPTKPCTACKEVKILHDFQIGSAQCKVCRAKYQKERRNKDPLIQWANDNKSSQRLEREKFVRGRDLQHMQLGL